MSDFDEERLLGTWHIVASNFPMWLKGDRTDPQFHYGQLTPGRLSDRVTFVSGGRERQIRGVDTRLPGEVPAYRWRGKGMLSVLRSDWQVAQWDPGYRWALITFAKSLVTPAGADLIVRSAEVTNVVREQAQACGLSVLKDLTRS